MPDGDDTWRERGLRDAALAGDAAAWRELFAAHADRLERYAAWRCGGHGGDADEVVQDTWLTAARRLGDFRPECGPFAAWLVGIAARVLANHFRGRRRHSRRRRPLAETPAPAAEPAADAERVALALAELPARYEQALRVKYFDGRCVAELAAELGQSVKAAESLLTRAREAFKAAYLRREEGP